METKNDTGGVGNQRTVKGEHTALDDEIAELRRTKDRWNRLLEILDDEVYFFTHGTDTVFTYVSPSVENILGYSQQEYMRSFEDDWSDAPINKAAREYAKKSIEGIKQPPYEMEVFHKDGSARRAIVYETPIFDHNGRVIAVEGMVRDVTKKRALEAKLNKYQQHLEEMVQTRTIELENSKRSLLEIIEFIPDALYVVDQNKNIVAWNRAIERLTNMSREAVLHSKFYNILGEFYQSSNFLIMKFFAGGQSDYSHNYSGFSERIFSEERFIPNKKTPGGRYYWLTAASILDNNHQFVGAIECIRDITEEKNARLQIVESERRLFTLMNNLPGMAYRMVKGKTWAYEFVSNGSRNLIDKNPAELVGKSMEQFNEFIHPDDRIKRNRKLMQCAKSGQRFQLEYRLISTGGEDKWAYEQGEALLPKNKEPVAIEGFVTDFTIYKKIEEKLREENYILKSSMGDRYRFDDIIGSCPAMQNVYELILKASTNEDNVFIYGESGTGKELVAQAIHRNSKRAEKPFVAVNCGAVSENLIESEFFGHKKGAFTGAETDKQGYLDFADGGTLFLDEISEISLGLQVKLLRAIEGGGFSPVGSYEVKKPDVRIIAASNKDLEMMLKKGKFRQDFFYRIHVIPINLPALRDRGDDLLLLIDHFLKKFDLNNDIPRFSATELAALRNHSWPGNVRELQNVLRRYAVIKSLKFMKLTGRTSAKNSSTMPSASAATSDTLRNAMESYEKEYIENVLKMHGGNRKAAARNLDLPLRTFFRKLKRFDIR